MKKHIFFLFFLVYLLPIRAIDYLNWMQALDDNLFLSRLSIPGAHDAATSSCSSSGLTGSAHTQTYTIAQQLEHGVRMFDLRPAWTGKDMIIYHGIVSTDVKFADALTTLCNFLDAHPQEFIFVIMRHEDDGESDSQKAEWPNQMGKYLAAKKQYIIDYRPSLTVKDMRGKILVMSRNTYEGELIGGYLNGGGDNSVYDRTLSGTSGAYMYMSTQDMYDVAATGQLSKKVTAIRSMLARSLSEKEYRLYLNHASGYSKKTSIFGFSFSSYEGVQECARTCNKAIINYMKEKKGPMGLVLMDFAGDDEYQGQELIDLIINNCYNTYVGERESDNHIVKGKKAYIAPLGRDRLWEGLCFFMDDPKNTASSLDVLSAPDAVWNTLDFSPSDDWVSLQMPLGSPSYQAPYRTVWEGEYNTYWIRREFMLEEVNEATVYYLEVYHDDHYDIYVNGSLVDKANTQTQANGTPVTKIISNTSLVVGKNVIAVHIQQNTGGAYFDCGIYGVFNPDKQDAVLEIEEEKTTSSFGEKAVVYDLSGRKVTFPEKGLYIIEGQKKVFQ